MLCSGIVEQTEHTKIQINFSRMMFKFLVSLTFMNAESVECFGF